MTEQIKPSGIDWIGNIPLNWNAKKVKYVISDIKDGTLYFDGCDTTELAKKYGTPLYVISAKMIKDKFAQLQEEFISKYPKARVAYACKAFCTKEMLRLCAQEGVSIDVVSGGELFTAMAVDFPPERMGQS